jgi:hypothetical protein
MMALCSQQSLLLQQIHHAIQQDRDLATIKAQCEASNYPDPHYKVQHDLLFWNNRLVVPKNLHITKQILVEYHASPIGGLEFSALKLASVSNSFGHTCLRTLPNLSQNASYVSQPSLVPLCHQAFSSRCQFHHKFGMMSQWIL